MIKDLNYLRNGPNKIWYTYNYIKQSCYNTQSRTYLHNGFKGIIMSQEFLNNFDIFVDYILKLGYNNTKSIKEQVICRIDYTKNYEKGNLMVCSSSIRNRKKPNKYNQNFKGEPISIRELAIKLNMSKSSVSIKIIKHLPLKLWNNVKKYKFRNKWLTLKQISKLYNIKYSTLIARQRYKINLDHLLWGKNV